MKWNLKRVKRDMGDFLDWWKYILIRRQLYGFIYFQILSKCTIKVCAFYYKNDGSTELVFFVFREMGMEGEREEEKHQMVASHMPPTGDLACNSGHLGVCWPGIEPATFRLASCSSVHWATPARDRVRILESIESHWMTKEVSNRLGLRGGQAQGSDC